MQKCIGEKSVHEGYPPAKEVHRREDLRADTAKQEWPLYGERCEMVDDDLRHLGDRLNAG